MQGFAAIAGDRGGLLLVTGLGTAQTFTRGPLNVLSVVVAIDLLDAGAAGVGVLNAALGAGAVVGSILTFRLLRRGGLAMSFGVGVALWGLPLIVLGAAPQRLAAIALVAVIGFGNALVDAGVHAARPAGRRDRAGTDVRRLRGAPDIRGGRRRATHAARDRPPRQPVRARRGRARGAGGGRRPLGGAAPARRAHACARRGRRDPARGAHAPRAAAGDDRAAGGGLEHAEIAPGRPVFEQGERGERFFVVEAGRAEVLRDDRSVATLGRGDCFGEIALLRDCVRTATVRAFADAPLRVSVLPRDPFLTAVTGYPASAMAGEHVVRARLEALALPPIQSAAEPGYNGADGGGCDGPGTGRRPLIHVAVTRRRIVSCSGSSAGRLAVARRAAPLRPSLPVCASCASHAG
jgi:hypothetical protein